LPDDVALERPRSARPRSPWPGGETEGRRLTTFLSRQLDSYRQEPDDLAADQTSQLGPYLHFGCVSPLELAERGGSNDAFVRQLCWRDFYLQLLAAHPTLPRDDLRRRDGSWRDDDEALDAWRRGETGYPIVDAAMRQLETDGWMHNRARLVVASFLTKQLGIDWRRGAEHFAARLIDGDLASNSGNWQWVAGTGTNPRPNQTFNPIRQALRHDPRGDFVRRHVPELGYIPGAAVHTPWSLDHGSRYPPPIVDQPGATTQ
jgi:deoxyribodipyrimidine photo-lyase